MGWQIEAVGCDFGDVKALAETLHKIIVNEKQSHRMADHQMIIDCTGGNKPTSRARRVGGAGLETGRHGAAMGAAVGGGAARRQIAGAGSGRTIWRWRIARSRSGWQPVFRQVLF